MSLTPEQIEQRKGLITASEAAAVLGLNPWKTRHQYWAEKTGESPPFRGNFKTRRGHAVEPLLLEWLGEQRAPLVVKPSGDVTMTHPILTWLGATPDALIFDPRDLVRPIGIGEAKSTGMVGDWTDEDGEPKVPDYYHPQVVVQMAVAKVDRALVVAEILDPREKEPWIIEVERDAELEAIVLEALDSFRRLYIETRTPPPLGDDSGYSDIAACFRRVRRAEVLPALPADDELARAYLDAVHQRKLAEEWAEKTKAALCARIGDAEGIGGDTWRATWKERAESTVSYTKKAYRHFDLRAKKSAKDEAAE